MHSGYLFLMQQDFWLVISKKSVLDIVHIYCNYDNLQLKKLEQTIFKKKNI